MKGFIEQQEETDLKKPNGLHALWNKKNAWLIFEKNIQQKDSNDPQEGSQEEQLSSL